MQWCENEHLEWDSRQKTAYGIYDGFPLSIISFKGEYLLCLFCQGEVQEPLKADTNYENGRFTTKIPQQNSPSLMYLFAAVNHLCGGARSAGLKPSVCVKCGGDEHLRVWKCGGEYTVLCINCREILAEQEKAEIKNAPPELPDRTNIIGAVIGALLGLIFYTIVYQLGSFAPLCGAALAFFIALGYNRGSGAFTQKAFQLCSLIGVFTIIIAQCTALWLTLYISFFLKGITFLQSFQMLPKFLAMGGTMRAALSDIILAIIPMLLITLWFYLRQRKKQK